MTQHVCPLKQDRLNSIIGHRAKQNIGAHIYSTTPRNKTVKVDKRGTRQLGPRTTRTETSRPVSEDKSARKRGLVGPYVKTTRTV